MSTPTPGSFTDGSSIVQYAISPGNPVPALVLGHSAATPPVLSLFVFVDGQPGYQVGGVAYDGTGNLAGSYNYNVATTTPGALSVGGDLSVAGTAAITGVIAGAASGPALFANTKADQYGFNAGAAFAVTTSGSDLIAEYANSGGFRAKNGNSGTTAAYMTDAGVEVPVVGQGFILKSPDGTRYLIQVANGGALSTSVAP